MGIFDISNTLFSFGGANISILEFFSVLFGLTCVFLAGRGKIMNFWFGYISAILLFMLFFQKHLYSSMILQPISLSFAIFGHYKWAHPKKDEANSKNELKISILTWKDRGTYLAAIAIFTIIWGWCMKQMGILWPDTFPQATRPFLDAFVMSMILLAQYLSAQKKLDCWGAWLIVNTTNIILYILAGLAFMPLVSTGYLILAFFGFAMWRKQWRNQ